MLSGGALARYKDGVDHDHKYTKRLAFNVQAGGWSVAREHNRQDGRIVKAPGTDPEWKEEMATATSSQLVPSESRSSTNARSDLAFAGVL